MTASTFCPEGVEGKKKRKARRESALHNSTMTDFTEQEIV
jgi:hypothetical protein